MHRAHDLVIINIFQSIDDPRKKDTKNKLYPLVEILLIAFATLLSGGENYVDMHNFGKAKIDFFKTLLPFKNGIPSADTYERVFGLLNPKKFEQCLTEWSKYLQINYAGEIISIDGKSARRSGSKGVKPIHMVNAWANKNKIVLSCKALAEKSNEITAIPEVLSMLSLKGTIVTMDAMGCQYELANQIVDQAGNYVFSLKGNQSTLHDDVKTFFELEKKNKNIELHETLEKDHGRIERRKYGFFSEVQWLKNSHPKWRTVNGIGFVTSKRTTGEKITEETRYFVVSQNFGVISFAEAVRAHWGVENSLHNFLDVAMHEDNSRVRDRNAVVNLSIVRRMAINRIGERKDPKRSKRTMRLVAGWDNDYLKALLIPVG